MADAEKLIAWMREGADELEKAHLVLDMANIPRKLTGTDVEYTLSARIVLGLGADLMTPQVTGVKEPSSEPS